MFEWLSRMIFPIIIIALASFLGLIVLQWGLDYTSRGQYGTGNYAAKINGEEIPWPVFNRAYQDLYQKESQNSDAELPDSKLRELETSAWNQILQDRLLSQEADKLDLSVTEDEVYQYLRYSPPAFLQDYSEFQTDGKFDYQKYFSAMLDPNAAAFWASVEGTVRSDIKKIKLQQLLIQSANISEDEIRQFYLSQEEKVKVAMINVAVDQYDEPPLEIADDDLLKYYQDRLDDYAVGRRAVLSFVKLSKEASDEDWETSRARLSGVYDSLMAGSSFEEMARIYSQDVTASQGGDLGWFEQGRMVPEFNQLAFSMEEGEISEPFRTQFGWHIIKHLGYRTTRKVPQGKTAEEDVREAHCSHILMKTTMSANTLDGFYRTLEALAANAREIGLEAAAEAADLPVQTTRPFADKDAVQFVGREQVVWDFALNNPVGTISDVINTENMLLVASIAELHPEGTKPFDEVKEQVRVDLRMATYRQMSRDTALAIYEMIMAGTDFQQAANDKGVRYVEPDAFSRTSFVSGIGRSAAAIGVAFSLTEPGQISKPVDHNQGTVILKLLERTSPDLTHYTEIRDSLSSDVLLRKQQQLYGKWFKSIMDRAEIENNIDREDRRASAN